MKLTYTTLMTLTLIWTASAQASLNIPPGARLAIENTITQQMKKRLQNDGIPNHTLEQPSFDWAPNSFNCVKAEALEQLPETEVGACVITVRAGGVTAQAAIIKKDVGYAVSILQQDFE